MLKGANTPWTEEFDLDERLFADQAKRPIESGYRPARTEVLRIDDDQQQAAELVVSLEW